MAMVMNLAPAAVPAALSVPTGQTPLVPDDTGLSSNNPFRGIVGGEQPQPPQTDLQQQQLQQTQQPQEPQQQQQQRPQQPQVEAMPSLFDVSSLIAPFDGGHGGTSSTSAQNTTTKDRTKSGDSNDTESTAAPLTPISENDDDNVDDEDEDTDEEEDSKVPLPRIILSRCGGSGSDAGGDTDAGNDDDNDDDDDDLAWAEAAPPAALTEILSDDVPELLRAIVASSIESLQAQLAVALAERAERAEKAAAAARAREEERARERQQARERAGTDESDDLIWPLGPSTSATSDGSGSGGGGAADKGKARDNAARQMIEPDASQLRPLPLAIPAVKRPSRRQMFASRLMRHVHVLGGGASERGESSAAGAAAGASAAAAAAAVQRQIAYDGGKSAAPGFRWVGGNGESWRLVPVAPTSGWVGSEGREESTAQGLPTIAVSTEMGTAPIPTQKRTAMLLAMVKKDMEKKKEPVPPATIECISCFEDVPAKEAVKTVCHSYCLDCFQQLVTTALENEAQFPPKCCLNEVPSKTVLKYVPRDLGRQYTAKADEFAIPVADRLYCPVVDCGVFVPKSQIAAAARIARCRNGHETCTACRQTAHGRGGSREPCPEVSAADQRDQRLADELAAEEGWRRCIRCDILVDHRDACQHMTCRCGAEFCYVCGAAWRSCACGMDDLNRLKEAAVERRLARTAREQRERDRALQAAQEADRELAEVREALRLVEEFEEQENARLETVRRAQRRRLRRLRSQREAALRVEVASKYADLRAVLAALGQLQASAARQARRNERVAHRAEQAAARAALDARQAEERAADAADAAAKVKQAERAWQRDYCERVLLEMQLEAAYRQVLGEGVNDESNDSADAEMPWAGRKDRAQLAARALRAYQRTNDARLDAYLAWRDRELGRVRFLADEERVVRGEVLDSRRRQHRAAQRAAVAAQKVRHAGERVWCRAAAAERLRLLAEMEAVEQELGLAGSTSEADASLLLLLELEENGTLGGAAAGGGDQGGAVDTDMDHFYAVMLADVAGDLEDFDYEGSGSNAGGGDNDDDNQWVDDDADNESFYSLYADGERNGNNSNNSRNGSGSGNRNGARTNANWPLVVEDN